MTVYGDENVNERKEKNEIYKNYKSNNTNYVES